MLKLKAINRQLVSFSGCLSGLPNNLNGPSPIKVPDWIGDPLGKYYLYFASHKGSKIELAYSDSILGPWRYHPNGVLTLEESTFPRQLIRTKTEYVSRFKKRKLELGSKFTQEGFEKSHTAHIASPDVHLDKANRTVKMYFHGIQENMSQSTRLAVSKDGLAFDVVTEDLGPPYMRVFDVNSRKFAIASRGVVLTQESNSGVFTQIGDLGKPRLRHCDVYLTDSRLYVFWSQVGDSPEHILVSEFDSRKGAPFSHEIATYSLLKPEFAWEGANLPNIESRWGAAWSRVNQIRDPGVLVDGNKTHMFYSICGEAGFARCELVFPPKFGGVKSRDFSRLS